MMNMEDIKISTGIIDMSLSAKHSALYFNEVIPLLFGIEVAIAGEDNAYLNRILKKLVPESFLRDPDSFKSLEKCLQNNITLFREHINAVEENRSPKPLLADYSNDTKRVLDLANEHAGYQLPYKFETELPADNGSFGIESKTDGILLGLSTQNLVDVEKATWEQLLKFREDHESVRKLKRLLHFFDESYQGRDLEFIKNDIQTRLWDYDETVKKWGFETTAGSIGLVTSSKSLFTTAGMGIASFIAGAPATLASMVALSGVIIELTNISLHVATRKYQRQYLVNTNPISYIISAKEKFN